MSRIKPLNHLSRPTVISHEERALRALDWLNFFLADLRGGMGAYVNVFLFAHAGWDPETLGAVPTISGLVGITLHAPIMDVGSRTELSSLALDRRCCLIGHCANLVRQCGEPS